ncbi:squalene--hopene cyclase [Longirhabdus pacifica]|uniref:squalene--hopene cyclase n=1 Tax=Longirhabdus pacifica TaxID=2305227 RepID=UPI001008E69A|nr:squalene--hopene cyclase [Longirhabdus pacifica]
MRNKIDQTINQMLTQLVNEQSTDGTWRYCFELGVTMDAYMIILLRSLQIQDEVTIQRLCHRIFSKQQANGSWKVFPDEKGGNLEASVEAYYALLYSHYVKADDPRMLRAKQFILSRGGLNKVKSLMTQMILAVTGQYSWDRFPPIPIEMMILPTNSPIHFYDFSGYARVHIASLLILYTKKFAIVHPSTPQIQDMIDNAIATRPFNTSQRKSSTKFPHVLMSNIKTYIKQLSVKPEQLRSKAMKAAERFLLERIEGDGTLYSYASSTFLMVYALSSLGYKKDHSVIKHAIQGLYSMACCGDQTVMIQNSPSTVWDTALIHYAMQQAGVQEHHPSLERAKHYLTLRQHHKISDWGRRLKHPQAGGWGFSDSNTINPDVDTTTATLRALHAYSSNDTDIRKAAHRGFQWMRSMQNKDGGWPAFEKETNKKVLKWIPLHGAQHAAVDLSCADLTGRALEYLGNFAALTNSEDFVAKAVRWLYDHQEMNGSWYGRWGICYIYGTWAALTGLMAVQEKKDHPCVQRAVNWLLKIQHHDGGWGESCVSDQRAKYVPLAYSTLSHSAWAVDALIATHDKPIDAIEKGIQYLIDHIPHEKNDIYPTGGALPGIFYIRYYSYNKIWPLLALAHYKKKFGAS